MRLLTMYAKMVGQTESYRSCVIIWRHIGKTRHLAVLGWDLVEVHITTIPYLRWEGRGHHNLIQDFSNNNFRIINHLHINMDIEEIVNLFIQVVSLTKTRMDRQGPSTVRPLDGTVASSLPKIGVLKAFSKSS